MALHNVFRMENQDIYRKTIHCNNLFTIQNPEIHQKAMRHTTLLITRIRKSIKKQCLAPHLIIRNQDIYQTISPFCQHPEFRYPCESSALHLFFNIQHPDIYIKALRCSTIDRFEQMRSLVPNSESLLKRSSLPHVFKFKQSNSTKRARLLPNPVISQKALRCTSSSISENIKCPYSSWNYESSCCGNRACQYFKRNCLISCLGRCNLWIFQ